MREGDVSNDPTLSLSARRPLADGSAERLDDLSRLRRWLRTRLLVEARGEDDSGDLASLTVLRLQQTPTANGRPLLLEARDALLRDLPPRPSDPELTSHQTGAALADLDRALQALTPAQRDLLILQIEFGLDRDSLARIAQLAPEQLDARLAEAALALAAAMP